MTDLRRMIRRRSLSDEMYNILALLGDGSISTVDFLACYVKKVNNIFNLKRSWSKYREVNRTEPFPLVRVS